MRNDLWDCVASQLDVSGGDMRQAERNYVAYSLDLVDDSVSVGQAWTVLRGRLFGLSNHTVYLSLDLCCAIREYTVFFTGRRTMVISHYMHVSLG